MILFAFLAAAAAPQAPINKGARAFYFAYGNCIVADQPRRAAEAVLSDVDDARFLKRYPTFAEGGCVDMRQGTWGYFNIRADSVRYSLADALVRKEFAGSKVSDFSALPALDHGTVPSKPSEVGSNGKPIRKDLYAKALADYRWKYASNLWSNVGECIVRENSSAAHALLLSDPDSAAEDAQLAGLKQAVVKCLPESESMQLNELSLRGTIAVNFYRLATSAKTMATK